ncbi:uncharacterized protein RJT20DRAFT_128399 [Scheffersomyces xylosifermentans]|uniref:uncharacterized protein n=1 Tax=Scheffersomyces xylosifermentans TaxID=1304137 RepID=UPI00315DE19C
MSKNVEHSRQSAPSESSVAALSNRYTYNKFGSRKRLSDRLTVAPSGETLKDEVGSSSETRSPSENRKKVAFKEERPSVFVKDLDYNNHYIHTGQSPVSQIRNIKNPIEGYPKLNKLHTLKKAQVVKHSTKPYGVRIRSDRIIPTINSWIEQYSLKFDVIMIGALIENQFILPLLQSIPIHKLCSKPGFLFIWATTQKISELTVLLNNENFNKKFRRSEELIFLPVDKTSPYYPADKGDGSLLQKQQWHCWMCITGTVRRSTDNHLIHCNVDTDLQIESPNDTRKNAVPDSMYRVAENFSNSNRRLHIVPSKTGYDMPIRLREGWVIMGPDVILNNFHPAAYIKDLSTSSLLQYKTYANGLNSVSNAQYLVPQTDEIEDLRPKSPTIAGKKLQSQL